MMQTFKVIIEKINHFRLFIVSKFSALKELFLLFLYSTFGKDKVLSTFGFIIEKFKIVNKRLFSHLNSNGDNYALIKKIYILFYRSLFGVLVYLFLLNTNFLWLTGGMPSIDQLQNPKLSQASTILSADGIEIGKYFAENRTPVDSASISPWVFKALISTEDKRFFQHSGIDLRRIGSVALCIVSGKKDQGGGSTISQQLAKNLYSTRKKEMRGLLYYIPFVRTIIYKTKEWLTAIQLEKRFTKGEIATMYLNTVDYGNNAFGIKTAAKTYFNKTPDKLNISESAILVGLQKATTYYNPIRNPKNSGRVAN